MPVKDFILLEVYLLVPLASEATSRGVLYKMVLLEISQNSQENTCARTSFLIKLQACNFNKNETLVQVFSCEFCEFSKNIICCRIPLVVASQNCRVQPFRLRYCSSKNLPVPQKYDSFWLRFEQFTWFC